jgi:ketosteroid isomerase-like protein
MKVTTCILSLAVSIVLCFTGTFISCNDAGKSSLAEVATKSDTTGAKQALISMYDFVVTKDLSDSLIFNQWMSFFTKDVLWMSSKGQAPGPVDFTGYRGVFKNNKAFIDKLIIDRVDASGGLAYVLYHFHEVVKTIKTNEVVADNTYSALVTLKKDASGKWMIALIAYA